MKVAKVPRLPHKSRLRRAKCHACHATSGGAKSDPIRRQASADIYEGSESTTPATQIEAEVRKVPRLPRNIGRQIRPNSSPSFRTDIYEGSESTTPATHIEPEVLKVPRLPRNIGRRQIRPNSSPSFRGRLWRYRKYHACHANRA